MHDARLIRAAWTRRALACAGLVSLGAGLLMLAAAPRSAAATQAHTHAARSCSVTAHGKNLYDPTTQKKFGSRSSVKVSQSCNLVNQFVDVSWTNFTPIVPNSSHGPFYTISTTSYGVIVAE